MNLVIPFGGCEQAGLEEDLEAVDRQYAEYWDSIYQSVGLQIGECYQVTLLLSSPGTRGDGG
jgi:hypothetical protein